MDPLSVTAGIVGILAAAAKVGEVLHSTISTAKEAPHVLRTLASEVQEVQAALSSLQILLADLSSTPTHRTALIQLDQLIVTLTESVLTFSELETAIAPFSVPHGAKIPLRSRLKWTRAENSCFKIVERLQRHKASISLMLNILQCASDADASRSQSSLELIIEKLLQSNQQMCRRLKNLEDTFDARSTFTKQFDSLSFISQADDATIRTARSTASKRMSILEAVRVRFAFDDDLQSSRVYRMAKNDNCNHSLLSSAIRTQTWSIFSGLSLADISVISVVALPLYPEDIQHHADCYSFGEPEEPSATEPAGTWTNQQVLVENHRPSTPDPVITMTVEDPDGSLIAVTDSSTSSMSSGPFSQDDASSSVSSVGSALQVDPTMLSKLESGSVEAQGDERHRMLDRQHIDAALDDPVSSSHAEKHQLDDSEQEDEDDVVYPCKGCGDILEEGKAFELDGNRWHIECFRCNTCGSAINADSNVLLLGDGSLLCKDCTYECHRCRNKIEDLAILTGDHAFCADCFRCRNCKRRIENLRYSRTSQGIFCMSCHESLMARRRKKKRITEPDHITVDQPSSGSTQDPGNPRPSLPAVSIDWQAPMFEDEGLSMLDDLTQEALRSTSELQPREVDPLFRRPAFTALEINGYPRPMERSASPPSLMRTSKGAMMSFDNERQVRGY